MLRDMADEIVEYELVGKVTSEQEDLTLYVVSNKDGTPFTKITQKKIGNRIVNKKEFNK
jgi:hypothetical protein